MSLPKFPDIDPDMSRENSLNLLIRSIAMEEAALSYILEAESEKINFTIDTLCCSCCVDLDKLIQINRSVDSVLEKIADMQILLKNTLKTILNYSEETPISESECESPCEPNPVV